MILRRWTLSAWYFNISLPLRQLFVLRVSTAMFGELEPEAKYFDFYHTVQQMYGRLKYPGCFKAECLGWSSLNLRE